MPGSTTSSTKSGGRFGGMRRPSDASSVASNSSSVAGRPSVAGRRSAVQSYGHKKRAEADAARKPRRRLDEESVDLTSEHTRGYQRSHRGQSHTRVPMSGLAYTGNLSAEPTYERPLSPEKDLLHRRRPLSPHKLSRARRERDQPNAALKEARNKSSNSRPSSRGSLPVSRVLTPHAAASSGRARPGTAGSAASSSSSFGSGSMASMASVLMPQPRERMSFREPASRTIATDTSADDLGGGDSSAVVRRFGRAHEGVPPPRPSTAGAMRAQMGRIQRDARDSDDFFRESGGGLTREQEAAVLRLKRFRKARHGPKGPPISLGQLESLALRRVTLGEEIGTAELKLLARVFEGCAHNEKASKDVKQGGRTVVSKAQSDLKNADAEAARFARESMDEPSFKEAFGLVFR